MMVVAMSTSEIVTIDLGHFQRQVQQASGRVRQAEARARAARELVAEAENELDAAMRDLAVAENVENSVRQAIVNGNGAGPVATATASIEAPIDAATATTTSTVMSNGEVVVGSISNRFRGVPTKMAVLVAMSEDPERVFSLKELWVALRAHGFQGTYNSVHVAVSRIMSGGNSGIERVRQGHYRYVSADDAWTTDNADEDEDDFYQLDGERQLAARTESGDSPTQ